MVGIMSFAEDRLVYVRDALDPALTEIARNYTLFDETLDYRDEAPEWQVRNCHSKWGDPFMEALLLHMLPLMERVTNLRLLPTYTVYRVYRKGHALKPHVDRPACEISASLCLGFTDDTVQWPLYVEDVAYVMQPGDLIAYRGLELNHYRYPLECSYSWSQSQVFLHYVDADGPHADQVFDGRSAIGTPAARRA
jgi:hypothetical protein